MMMSVVCIALASLAPVAPAGDFAAFVDGAAAAALREHHVPGAVIAIVDRDGLLHGKGYGDADIRTRRPVDFDTTAFEVASVSKLFAAIAVMQFVENGGLALDVDINGYLESVQVPDAFDEPVTLGHLLTHTAGFDERAIGMATTNPDDAQPLAQFVRRRLPPRVRPPGTVASYSNMSFALAGLIVQEAAGQPFEEYVAQRILDPLGMGSSSFRRPHELRERMARPYQFSGGKHQPRSYNYMHGAPAGALAATGSDMARFMLACLNGGALGEARILEDDTLEAMYARYFTHHPGLEGMGIGFFRETINGKAAVSHTGYLRGFSTVLALFPAEGIGIFLSNNGDSNAFNSLVLRTVAEHLLGPLEPEPGPAALDGWEERVRPFLGRYRPTRTGITSLEKLASFINQPQLRVTAPGVVRFGNAQRIEEVEPGLFRDAITGQKAAMVTMPDERPLFVRGGWAFERLRWYETTLAQGAYLAVCLLVFASALLWPFGWIRRPQFIGLEPPGRFQRWAWAAPWVVSLCNIAFLVGVLFAMLGVDQYEFFLGLPTAMRFLLVLPIVSTALLLFLLPAAFWTVATGAFSTAARTHYAIVALTALAFVPFLVYWNLLGFNW